MDHFLKIYASEAAAYQRMIAREDGAGELQRALARLARPNGRSVLDLGCGTGRFGQLFAAQAASWIGLDLHAPMLLEGKQVQAELGQRWPLLQGDVGHLPLLSGWADVVLLGWVLGHFVSWFGEEWVTAVDQAISEALRVAQPGATLIICETLGTGTDTPAPPTPGLAAYYHHLETSWGFRHEVVRTDYHFATVAQAAAATRFFFGEEMAQRIVENRWSSVPESTGIWWRTK